MPLPTTNLTLHCDASANTDVWKFFQAGTPFHNTTAADGDNVEVWDDVEHGSYALIYPTSGPQGPTYSSSSPAMLHPCLLFDGFQEHLTAQADDGSALAMSALCGGTAKTILIAFHPTVIATSAANPYDNVALVADGGANFGIHLKDMGGGVYNIIAYNWDTGADTISAAITLNEDHVVCVRHDGTNLYMSVDGTDYGPTASNATNGGLAGACLVGANSAVSGLYQGAIGEVAFYNASLTGTNLTDALAYFSDKWLNLTPPGTKVQQLTLVDTDGSPLANLTGLKCFGWDTNVLADIASTPPTDYTATATTDASGVLIFERPNTTLAAGNIAFVLLAQSDGSLSQSPPARAFFGPVQITEV